MAAFRNCFRLYNYLPVKKISNAKVFHQSSGVLYASTGTAQLGSRNPMKKILLVLGGCGIGGALYGYLAAPNRRRSPGSPVLSEVSNYTKNENIPDGIVPSRVVSGPATTLGLNLTLFQYQTCPFCCKVRAFLEYYGIPYNVIEVNPVMRQQLKFTNYKKVPILIAREQDESKHQLNDSTVIISILGTLLMDVKAGLKAILPNYAPQSYTDENGKQLEEVMNKYFLMYGDKKPKESTEELIKERKWCKWADQEFVHVLSPNIYRTYDEALQSFNYFSVAGEWEKNFSTFERLVVIYVGATAMYFIGRKLKKKYALKDDVRQSLYDSCKLWMKEVGPRKKFRGGDIPDLADLAVYGLLSSIEGCQAFKDLLSNTNVGTWYYDVKEAVRNHHGYKTLNL